MSHSGGSPDLPAPTRRRATTARGALGRWWRARRRPVPDPVVGLVLSGGGASASFQVGALRYLYDVEGIAPSVVTGTSAGSVLAALLAQAEDAAGQREVLDRIEARYGDLRQPSDLMVELEWFTELQKLVPALQRVGQARASHLEPQTITLPALGRGRRRTGEDGALPAGPVIRLPRWDATPVRETLSAVWSVSRARPDFEALLRGGRHEQSLYRRGPIFDALLGPEMFDPERLARSATELRVATVALESGALRYVTGRGTLVDRGDQPVPGEGPVPLVDALHASCAIPAIYPPVRLGAEHYVDGGTRENLPVDIAVHHLGVTRCYAVNAIPTGVPVDTSYAEKDMLAIVLRAAAGIMSDEVQLDDLHRAEAAGAVVITPEVDVLGVLEVDPGLLALAQDYGYLRAAEACEGASDAEQEVTRELVELRRTIWKLEVVVAAEPPGVGTSAGLTELAALKARLSDLVTRVPAGRLPAGADRWWRTWEGHLVPVDLPVSWLDGAQPPG
ncbi:patatin-like phospholipase family protein [Microlunatus capsulatus]|uniref:Acylesterase/phospholipase RssA n=1 Tax=Microlunatus capsulatus TaxID=99117 RepID=A0ABS4Z2A4_9ACTN|nr:patatin-like phospholipase family protein [Microlunatus capsulatus]MBP2415178.1 putative acylesterase/phospholipase RssA [Microlunatus capsulatus]